MRLTISGPSGSGKTALTALYAVNEARQGRSVLWEGASDGLANEQIAACSDLATELDLRFVDSPGVGKRELMFASGGLIHFVNGSAHNVPEREQHHDVYIGDEMRFSGKADRQLLTRMTL